MDDTKYSRSKGRKKENEGGNQGIAGIHIAFFRYTRKYSSVRKFGAAQKNWLLTSPKFS